MGWVAGGGQALAAGEFDRQGQAGFRGVGQAQQAQAADLQQAGQGRRRAGHAVVDIHPVVGDH